ncbi:MAG: CCA tRNA nucleotidyltransferase [Bacillota bacterium]
MDLVELKKILPEISKPLYLVGGVIRDYLLNKDLEDIDLVVPGAVKGVAQEFAQQVNGTFVTLDSERKMYRVVTSDLVYDFNSLAGDSIEEDLKRRDFTINALALKIDDSKLDKQNLIDPYGGMNDLEEGIIKAVSTDALLDDPLRILRGVRFKAQFGFAIAEKTKELAAAAVDRLQDVANERIKEELLKILSFSEADNNIKLLEGLGFFNLLLPKFKQLKIVGPCKYHQEAVWEHAVFAVTQVEELLAEDYWRSKIEATKIPLLKLAALLHDYGKIFTEKKIDGQIHFYGHQKVGSKKLKSLFKKWKFSNQELDYIVKLVRYHMRPLALYYADNLTFKGKHRFFKAGGEVVEDICLLAAADKMSTSKLNNRAEEIAGSLVFLRELIADKEEFVQRTTSQLITGNELITELGLEEGPQIGEILDKIEEKQAQGELTTTQEALRYAQKLKKRC